MKMNCCNESWVIIFKYYTAFIMKKTDGMGEGGGAEGGEAF